MNRTEIIESKSNFVIFDLVAMNHSGLASSIGGKIIIEVEFDADTIEDTAGKKYRLIDIVIHIGSEINSGHYVNAMYNMYTKQWILLNDDKEIKKFSNASTLIKSLGTSSTPKLLLLERVSDDDDLTLPEPVSSKAGGKNEQRFTINKLNGNGHLIKPDMSFMNIIIFLVMIIVIIILLFVQIIKCNSKQFQSKRAQIAISEYCM